MSKIIIFGNQEFAEIAHYYFVNDSNYLPVAFCVDGNFIKESKFCNLPIISYEEISKYYSTNEYFFHTAIYANKMNMIRKSIYEKIKNKGYKFVSYISSKSYTWNSKIGENSFVLEGCNIQPFTSVGNNNVIWSFTHLGHHSVIGDHNFISGHVVIAGHNNIRDNCFIGTNTATRDNIKISSFSFIGQSSSITKNIDEEGFAWIGSPAKKTKRSEEIEL